MPAKSETSPDIRHFRPFLPAKDFQTSLRFYEALGFSIISLGDTLAEVRLGAHAFLLQDYYVKDWAENMVMHALVNDLPAWWVVIDALALDEQFGVPKPRAPKAEPWGLTVCYVHDPAGVLWHFAEVTG
jgi:catechol 2,3-dioxygenase-like lactoylglutathione lyase family enzyme